MSDGAKGTQSKPSLTKLCQDRVSLVEKHYGQMCSTFGSITRKIARMMNRGDQLAKQVTKFADNESVSNSTSLNLKLFAVNLSGVQDYRHAEIQRLTEKVIKPLGIYGQKCKLMKGVIKKEQVAITKETKQRKNLEKVHEKSPGDAHSIAQTELRKASSESNIGIEGLNKRIILFEQEKLTDLKAFLLGGRWEYAMGNLTIGVHPYRNPDWRPGLALTYFVFGILYVTVESGYNPYKILLDYVSVELVFHAKAVEHYSRCFENLVDMDTDMDLNEFKRNLSLTQYHQELAAQESNQGVPMATTSSLGTTATSSAFGSTADYTTTEGSYTYARDGTSSMSASADKHVLVMPRSMYGDEDTHNDYDDDDDDDDDEEDDEYTGRR